MPSTFGVSYEQKERTGFLYEIDNLSNGVTDRLDDYPA